MCPRFLDGEKVEISSGLSPSTEQNLEIFYKRNYLLDIRSKSRLSSKNVQEIGF